MTTQSGKLSLVGLGLSDATDITVKGLDVVRAADVVYLEAYTSFLIESSAEALASFYQRPVELADREAVESGAILEPALAGKHVAVLVVGDVFGATTHSDLVVRCHAQKLRWEIIPNASILNAAGCCGLQLYRFGQVLSLCFWTEGWEPDSWYSRLQSNRAAGLHTLILLDIKVKEVADEDLARGRRIFQPPRFMTIDQAIEQILTVEKKKQGGAVDAEGASLAVGLARIGARTQQVVAGTMAQLRQVSFGPPLHALVIAGDVHPCEAEHLDLFRLPLPTGETS